MYITKKLNFVRLELVSSAVCTTLMTALQRFIINQYLVEFIISTRLTVTRWVKLSLNFELLVNRVMKFLLGQRLINNNIILYNLNYSISKKQPIKLNKRK